MSSQILIDKASRKLLPQQTLAMQQTMALGPPERSAPPQRENQRNYVFVDEHNRHKRLKVMRACEGCRRRKIKCDAATTNTWPCSACIRLKLQCVPPRIHYERDQGATQSQPEQVLEFGDSTPSADDEFLSQGHEEPRKQNRTSSFTHTRDVVDGFGSRSTHSSEYESSGPSSHHGEAGYIQLISPTHVNASSHNIHQNMYHQPSPPPIAARREAEEYAANDEIAAVLVGQLRIDDAGVATYINAQSRRLAENPAYEPFDDESEPKNPSFTPGQHEYAVKIRPEDYPSESEAAELLGIFFNHCHPYLPIVNKSKFMQQWESNTREQISPLLLETMFACAGRLMTDPGIGLKWISRAAKHVDCFMDCPRLSTVQALLILLKTRESAPQRGYFFRSWISIVTIIAMARDLGLETHHETHQKGLECPHNKIDCMTRTRVWQACFSYELMISAPQGREKMQCDPDTVDEAIPCLNDAELGLDDQEYCNHRNFIYLVRLIKNIRRMVDVHVKLKADPSWRNDPQFMKSAPSLDKWLNDLPPDCRIDVNTDLNEPPPHVGNNHFVGNMQVYYHLARTMLHRPALAYGKTYTAEGEWRHHMTICCNSAKAICRLEEVIFRDFGMLGLQCMNRGVNFSIYTLLTGAMIHLVAATCPHPEYNHDAREYFTRTMRLLENCIDNSASQEVKGQIETLREAFSVDLSRPFVLNPGFPFYMGPQASPVAIHGNLGPAMPETSRTHGGYLTHQPQQYHPVSPPYSTDDDVGVKDEVVVVDGQHQSTPIVMLSHSGGGDPNLSHTSETIHWNPSRLFDNWNAAFGVQANGGNKIPMMQHGGNTYSSSSSHGGTAPSSSSLSLSSAVSHGSLQAQCLLVSPGMWKDSVAAATLFQHIDPASTSPLKRPFPFTAGEGDVGIGGWEHNQGHTAGDQLHQHISAGVGSARTPPGSARDISHRGGNRQGIVRR